MAIAVTNPQSAQAATSSTTLTLASYNSGSGVDDVLVVAVHLETVTGTHPSSVTFGGVALTQAVTASRPDPPSSSTNFLSIWYLDAPSGTGDIVATWPATRVQKALGAVVLTGAKQGGPTDTQTGGGDNITTLDVTVNLSSASMTVIGAFASGADLTSLTSSQGGQTDRGEENMDSAHFLFSSKAETTSGNSTSGATGNAQSLRLVGALAAWEEAELTRVNSASFTTAASNTSLSTSYSVSAGPDRALAVFVTGERVDVTEPALTSVTYNGVAATSVAESYVLEGTNALKVFAAIFLEADLPASGSHTLAVTLSTGFSPGGAGTGFGMGVIEYRNARQTVPTNTLTVQEATNGTTISGSLTTNQAGSYIAAGAVSNVTGSWSSHSGTLLSDYAMTSSRGALGDELIVMAGLNSVSFGGASFGRAAMVAFEIEEVVSATGIGTPLLIANDTAATSGTSLAGTVDIAAAGGLTVLAALTMRSNSAPHPTALSMTDNASGGANSYVQDVVDGTSTNQLVIFRASDINALAVNDLMTASWTNDGEGRGLHVLKVDGLDLSSPLQASDIDDTASGTTPSASVTVPAGNWLLVGSLMQRGSTDLITQDANFTELAKNAVSTTHWHTTAYRIVSGAGTYSYQPTLGSSVFYQIGLAAYSEVGGAPPAVVLPGALMMVGI